MKKSRLCLFAFRPEHYREMEAYLQDMSQQGWRLKWCRGILAGFEQEAGEPVRYAVDPYAMTSLIHFRRYPGSRLYERMQEGWTGAGRSKGCQILRTTNTSLQSPVPAEDQTSLIRNTCRLASLLIVLFILGMGGFLLSKPAVVYTLILTNLYLVVAAIAAFLLVYHACNLLLLLLPERSPSNPRLCKRYLLHSGILLLLLLAAVLLMLGGRNDMMIYLLLPILVIIIGSIALKILSHHVDSHKLFPAVVFMGVVLFGLIIFANTRLSASSTQWTAQRQEELLAHADSLPVLHLADFGDTSEMQNAVQTNQSLLGSNLLYAEESETGYVFTNYTTTRSVFLAEQIFQHLYQQAQADFGEVFVEKTAGDLTYYALENANTYLLQRNAAVYFCTFPSEAEPEEMFQLLFARETPSA